MRCQLSTADEHKDRSRETGQLHRPNHIRWPAVEIVFVHELVEVHETDFVGRGRPLQVHELSVRKDWQEKESIEDDSEEETQAARHQGTPRAIDPCKPGDQQGERRQKEDRPSVATEDHAGNRDAPGQHIRVLSRADGRLMNGP